MGPNEMSKKEDKITLIKIERNYVTQFLMMLPQDYPTSYDAYPEILKGEETRNILAQFFGISIRAKVDVGYGFGDKIRDFIVQIFKAFEDDKVRNALSKFLQNVRREPVPDLRKEWARINVE